MTFNPFGSKEGGPAPLSQEEREKLIKYGFADEEVNQWARNNPEFARSLIQDKEKLLKPIGETPKIEESEPPQPEQVSVAPEEESSPESEIENKEEKEEIPLTEEQVSRLVTIGYDEEKIKEMDPQEARNLIELMEIISSEPKEEKKEEGESENLSEKPTLINTEGWGDEENNKPVQSEPVFVVPEVQAEAEVKALGEDPKDSLDSEPTVPALPLTQEELEKFIVYGYSDIAIERLKNGDPEEARNVLDKKEKYLQGKKADGATVDPQVQVDSPASEPLSDRGIEESELPVDAQAKEGSPREENLKSEKGWDQMTEDERKEKYEKSYEYREKIQEVRKARTNLVVIESELNKRKTILGRTKAGISKLPLVSKFMSSESVKDLEFKYEQARKNHQEKRAEYVGQKALRILKEKQKLAEFEASKHQEGKFEKFREGWRWLGDQNLEKWTGWRPTTRRGKIFARAFSARTVIGFGLLATGVGAGGSIVGLGALGMRRVLSGTGAGLGIYDVLRMADERKAIRDVGDVKKMSVKDIEQSMADLESRAKFGGKRVLQTVEYKNLRAEYLERLDKHTDKEEAIKEALLSAETRRLEKGKSALKRERRMKVEGLAAGLIVGSGAFAEGLQNVTGGIKDLAGQIKSGIFGAGVSEEDVSDAVNSGSSVSNGAAQELVANESSLPADTLNRAETVTVPLEGGNIEAGLNQEGKRVVDILGSQGEMVVPVEHIGTVKAGGSAWQAAREMIRNGAISKEEFAKAWSSPASTIELPSGQTIHISEFGLVHPGNQIVYIPETNGVPAHFSALDYAGKTLRVGSNEDLARAFDAAGRARPAWLVRALGAYEEAPVKEVTEAGISHNAPVGAPTEASPTPVSDLATSFGGGSEKLFTEAVNQTEGLDPLNSGMSNQPAATEVLTDTATVGAVSPQEAPLGSEVSGALSEEEIVNSAAENIFEPKEVMRFPWGTVDLVHDGQGHFAGYVINEEFANPRLRVEAVERAASVVLNSNYHSLLEEDIRSDASRILGESAIESSVAEAMPDAIAHLKEFAFRLQTLRQTFDNAEPYSKEWYYLRSELREAVMPFRAFAGKFMVGGRLVPTGIINSNIIP